VRVLCQSPVPWTTFCPPYRARIRLFSTAVAEMIASPALIFEDRLYSSTYISARCPIFSVSSSFISDDLREREDDLIWRVRWQQEWLYVYILLEFQSTIDAFMAVRILTYLGLFYQDLIKQQSLTARDSLPPVLPIVLYNGQTRWRAAKNIRHLIPVVPSGLEPYCPQLEYSRNRTTMVCRRQATRHATRHATRYSTRYSTRSVRRRSAVIEVSITS
jgi:hypothetical protein